MFAGPKIWRNLHISSIAPAPLSVWLSSRLSLFAQNGLSSSCLESHYLQIIIVIMAQNTILFLGAGGNIGASSVKLFKSKGYKVASVARTIRKEVSEHSDLVMTADFSDPTTIKGIFKTVERELGLPNVVVYNRK